MRRDASSNAVLLVRIENRAVLIALVQRVVSAFHEDFGPFDERSSQETGKGADEDFLEKRRLHSVFESSDDASDETLWRQFGMRFADF
jgi:hypothetical protein